MSLMSGFDLAVASAILEAVARVEKIGESVVRLHLGDVSEECYERCISSLVYHGHVQRHDGLLVLTGRSGSKNHVGEMEVTVRRSDRFGDTLLVKVKYLAQMFYHRTVVSGEFKHPTIYNQSGWRLDDMYWRLVDEEGGLRLYRIGYPRVIDLKTLTEMQVNA